MADKNIAIDIIAADRTKAAFESVKRGLGEVEGKLSAVKGVFGAFSALAATAGLTQIVTAAVQAAAKAEDSSKRLDAVLRATGNTVGFTRDQLDSMADSMAKSTTFDDEGVRDAMSVLAKFGKLHGEVFDRALKLSADYAAFTGGDMAEAAQAVGKAFADPINGGMMLERQFGKLTDAQDASIKKFMEQGNIMAAQQVWVEKLEGAIGGTAGAMNSGLTGATSAAMKSWDELMESMGRSGATKLIVENSLLSISALLDAVKKKMEDVNKETAGMIERSSGKLRPLAPEISGGGRGIGDLQAGATVDEMAVAGRAARARQDEEAALIRGANEKRAAAMQKVRAKAQEEIAAETYKRWQDQMRAHLKIVADLRQTDFDNATQQGAELRGLFEADQKQKLDVEIQSGEQMRELFERNKQDEIDKAERQEVAMHSLQNQLLTENEVRKFAYEEDFNLLNNTLGMKKDAQEQYYTLMGRLVQRNEKQKTAIEDAEIKKRYGIAKVYRRFDLNSAGFFADQMGTLMQTKSRKLFEIGKAAAIAGAIIDSYKAATGAYAALASITGVGPVLGAAAAAAALAVGFARVSAIKSTSFGSGGGGSVGTFAANPSTGLPESTTGSGFDAPVSPLGTSTVTRRALNLNIQFVGSGRYTQEEIRDSLIPALREAIDDGVLV